MLNGDSLTRDLLSSLIGRTIDQVVRKQLLRRAQEPSISSKIVQSLEDELDGVVMNDYQISVVGQDFPDRGPGSWEKKSGADIYIGVEVRNRLFPTISKGLLIQAKKARPLIIGRRDDAEKLESFSAEQSKTIQQCQDMLERSDKGSFVWVYKSGGTLVVPASEVVAHKMVPPEYLAGRGVDDQFRDVLECVAGDKALAKRDIFEDEKALGDFLEEIAVQRGVAIGFSAE